MKKTLSIGISAYNEAQNIKKLLHSILSQKENNFILKEIIVISDGSFDKTVEKVKEIPDKRIKLIADKKRLGKSERMNQILNIFIGDVLFLLDADISIVNQFTFSNILKETNFEKNGIVAIDLVPLPASNFFESCINHSVTAQAELRKRWRNGSNYFAFHGVFIGITKKLAKQIAFPKNLITNDGYIYCAAITKNYKPLYLPNVYIYYKSPSSFKDYLAQSSRYQSAGEELMRYFPVSKNEFTIPRNLLILSAFVSFVKNPVLFIGYIYFRILARIKKEKNITSRWTVASSTKKITL